MLRIGLIISLVLALAANGEKLDISTHNLLIEKLESSLSTMDRKSPERLAVTLRLADLYADRARLKLIAIEGEKCNGCDDGSADRNLAIKNYQNIIGEFSGEKKAEILLQLAHLYKALGNTDASVQQLKKITSARQSFSKLAGAKADAALAEIYFRRADYRKAEHHLRNALVVDEMTNRGFLTYRLAWAQLNQGRYEQATVTLESILTQPELLTVEKSDEVDFDDSFHQDVARDLVLFVARLDVDQRRIEKLLSLTPIDLRQESLKALAEELERLGKKYSATVAWNAYFAESDGRTDEKLETQVRLAQLNWDMGRKADALAAYTQAAQIVAETKCMDKADCGEIARRFRNFVITWHKSEKARPSEQLLSAYDIFLAAHPTDAELQFQAAEVAQFLKQHSRAAKHYAQAALLAHKRASDDKEAARLLEAALMRQIESAENSKNLDQRLMAYNNYLKLNANGSRSFEIRYQRAHVFYEKADYQFAVTLFKDLALTDKGPRAWRLKAADLALDSMAVLKDDERILQASHVLAAKFPERKKEYESIHRKAAARLAARTLADKKASESQLKSTLKVLQQSPMTTATGRETVTNLKNQVALSERLRDLNTLSSVVDRLLAQKSLTKDEKESALSVKLWLAELKLDFATALATSKKMRLNRLTEAEKQLRWALLAELAGQNPVPYYKSALRLSKKRSERLRIRTALIRHSRDPWKELDRHEHELKTQPKLVEQLVIELHSQKRNVKRVERYLKKSYLKKSSLAQIWAHNKFLGRLQSQAGKVAKHKLFPQSESLLQKSIQKRVKYLNELDKMAAEAARSQNWTGQILALISMAKEQKRMHDDLVKLPTPRQLKGAQREEYTRLLRAKADTFRARSESAERKADEFWANQKAVRDFQTAFRDASPEVQNLLMPQIQVLIQLAGGSDRREFQRLADNRQRQPTMREVLQVRQRSVRNPFDKSVLEELKDLEQRRGQDSMVTFLDARIDQLKSEVK